MKKYLLALLPALVLGFGSCKKDAPDLTGTTLSNGTSGNSASSSNDSYFPTTKGSSWTYQSDLTGTTKSAESHITGVIKSIDGEDYYEVKSSTPGNENVVQYNYAKGKKYKMRATTVQTQTTVDFFLLDDNLPVGGEWTAKMSPSGYINDMPARTQCKIIEKGIIKTVLNKTYKNVIHTHVTMQYDLGNGFEDYGDYDFYLAKGVGLIQTDASFFGFTSSTYLAAYTIK
ncbi:MAG: hypothetical protein JKY70_03440 [Mucilaginibacter sp.]|nr:hypothetical protein [Mucilaginibacter sp.]